VLCDVSENVAQVGFGIKAI
jgi:hypothetical protein